MRKNPNAADTRAKGTPVKGNAKPYANLPANNHGTFPVKLGAGQKSSFATNGKPGATNVVQPNGSKANTPAKNKGTATYNLGTTKHDVGGVPAYLKGR